MSKQAFITPKSPEQSWLESFFCPTLVQAKAYSIDTPKVKYKLDQNESPWDWPVELKQQVLEAVTKRQWNRYPETLGDTLNEMLAEYVGVPKSCVLTGPGSNLLISLVFDAIGRQLKGKVVLARPSFALFEMHCRYAGIPYETWDLNESLDYDISALPELPPGSLLVFASPNNPTGNSLAKKDLETLLKQNPQSYILADEAYYEFDKEPFTDLLEVYPNLMIMRTLSKTMGAAGVRLGYLLGSEELIGQLTKLRLPYLLNHFAMEAAIFLLGSDDMKAFVKKNIDNVVNERVRVHKALEQLSSGKGLWAKQSSANFLLLKFESQAYCDRVYNKLVEHGILVRDISAGPGLAGCLRMSIGQPHENDAFIEAVKLSLD